MDSYHIIRDYCLIRNQQAIQHGRLVFEGNGHQPGPLFTEMYKYFEMNYPKFHKMDNLCKLGFLASELLLKEENLNPKYAPDETGIVLYNAASSIDTDRAHQISIQDRSAYFPSPSVFVYTLANIVIGEICIRHKIYGESTFFIEEKFNVQRMHEYVMQLFHENIVQRCLTGWLEVDGDHYEGILYLIEKSDSDTDGIAIFGPEKLTELYSQRP